MRIKNIDLIKALAIFFVVVIHFRYGVTRETDGQVMYSVYYVFRNFLSIAVPLFIVCSGYLTITKKYQYKDILIKVVKLLVLALIYKIVSLLVMGGPINLKTIVDIFLDSAFQGNEVSGDYRTNYLWYIYCYMGILLFQPILHMLYQNKKNFLIFSAICLVYGFILFFVKINALALTESIDGTIIDKTFPLNSSYASIYGFYFIGALFKLYDEKLVKLFENIKTKRRAIIISLIIFIIALIVGSIWVMVLNNNFDQSYNPVTYHYKSPFGFLMATSFFVIFRYLLPEINVKPITYISRNSLGIYFIHWPISYLIKNGLFERNILASLPGDILLSLGILILCAVIVYLLSLNKITKKLVNV